MNEINGFFQGPRPLRLQESGLKIRFREKEMDGARASSFNLSQVSEPELLLSETALFFFF
jgi:hypothetical protein